MLRAYAQGHGQDRVNISDLALTERIPFPGSAPAAINPEIKCDLNGDIFAEYSESIAPILSAAPYGDAFQRLPLQELIPSKQARVLFELPSISRYPYLVRIGFDVDPHGKLYALMDAFDGPQGSKDRRMLGSLIVRYKDDGTFDSYITMGRFSEGHVAPTRFAALPDGTFLVIGNVWKEEGSHQFSALFDRAGKFVSYVKIPGDVDIKEATLPGGTSLKKSTEKDPKGVGGMGVSAANKEPRIDREASDKDLAALAAVTDSKLLSAPDGNVYLLRATNPLRLYAIAPGGDVVRQFEVQLPAPDLSPVQFGLAGISSIFIRFDYVAAGEPGAGAHSASLISVVDTSTGAVSASYRVDPREGDFSVGACSSSPYDFMFIGGTAAGKLELERFTAR